MQKKIFGNFLWLWIHLHFYQEKKSMLFEENELKKSQNRNEGHMKNEWKWIDEGTMLANHSSDMKFLEFAFILVIRKSEKNDSFPKFKSFDFFL